MKLTEDEQYALKRLKDAAHFLEYIGKRRAECPTCGPTDFKLICSRCAPPMVEDGVIFVMIEGERLKTLKIDGPMVPRLVAMLDSCRRVGEEQPEPPQEPEEAPTQPEPKEAVPSKGGTYPWHSGEPVE